MSKGCFLNIMLKAVLCAPDAYGEKQTSIDTNETFKYNNLYASVAELADALDLGSSALRRAGSIPVTRTISKFLGLLQVAAVLFVYKMLAEI